MTKKLWEVLVDRASEAARIPHAERDHPSLIAGELSVLAGDELEAVDTAWEHCVARYTEADEVEWLRAAAYLLAVSFELHKEHVFFRHKAVEAGSPPLHGRQQA